MPLNAALKSGRFMRCSRIIADGFPVQFPPNRENRGNGRRASSAVDFPTSGTPVRISGTGNGVGHLWRASSAQDSPLRQQVRHSLSLPPEVCGKDRKSFCVGKAASRESGPEIDPRRLNGVDQGCSGVMLTGYAQCVTSGACCSDRWTTAARPVQQRFIFVGSLCSDGGCDSPHEASSGPAATYFLQ